MYNKGIKNGIALGHRNEVISRKIYISYPTFAFTEDYEVEFEILNSISNEFKIAISSVQVVGSSKTGYSYFKEKDFVAGESDLDIAIIDPFLFQKFSELVMRETNGFRDLSGFKVNGEKDDHKSYKEYIARGIFRPDMMPVCDAKKKWFNFFNKLSTKYVSQFSDINAGIYASQLFFEYKQSENIDFYKRLTL